MKKSFHLLGLCLLLLIPCVHAQYSVTALQPPPQFTFNDLWRVSVLRTAADQNDAFYLSLRIFGGNNLLKVKSNTAVFTLPVGATFFDLPGISALQPFTTSYYDAGLLQQALSFGGVFPPGNYTFSYTLFGKSADGAFQPLTEENAQAVVEALWPPMLLSPPDGDTVSGPWPLLTWTPAFASYYNGPVDYTLRLVELLPGQNAFQAMAANPAHFTQSAIPVTVLSYPAAAQVLDTGRVYAWQVHASGAGSPMGESEIWTFTFMPRLPEEAPADSLPETYLELDRAYPVHHLEITEPVLRFRYNHFYHLDPNAILRFTLTREGSNEVIVSSADCPSCIIMTDKVYYTLPLENNAAFKQGPYLLSVTDDKQNTMYLRIFYRDANR